MKILGTVILIFGGFILLLLIKIKINANKPMAEEGYWDKVKTSAEIETKYMRLGDCIVKTAEYPIAGERWTNYTVWYPEEMEYEDKCYPLIVMSNGTGVQNSKYEPVFKHLSSWGFIVIGNDDISSGLGDSASKSLAYIMDLSENKECVFYKKIDMRSIGIAGHSQGGVATIHALYNFDNSNLYKAAYTASAATETVIKSWKLRDFEYDISKVNIPIFMVAGVGKTDSNTLSPLNDMKINFAQTGGSAIIARRKETDHGKMLYAANGYMVAWFRYCLLNDEDAKKAFVGEKAEILNNENWQDIHIKLLN